MYAHNLKLPRELLNVIRIYQPIQYIGVVKLDIWFYYNVSINLKMSNAKLEKKDDRNIYFLHHYMKKKKLKVNTVNTHLNDN